MTIISAEGLARKDIFGASDPYARVYQRNDYTGKCMQGYIFGASGRLLCCVYACIAFLWLKFRASQIRLNYLLKTILFWSIITQYKYKCGMCIKYILCPVNIIILRNNITLWILKNNLESNFSEWKVFLHGFLSILHNIYIRYICLYLYEVYTHIILI